MMKKATRLVGSAACLSSRALPGVERRDYSSLKFRPVARQARTSDTQAMFENREPRHKGLRDRVEELQWGCQLVNLLFFRPTEVGEKPRARPGWLVCGELEGDVPGRVAELKTGGLRVRGFG